MSLCGQEKEIKLHPRIIQLSSIPYCEMIPFRDGINPNWEAPALTLNS